MTLVFTYEYLHLRGIRVKFVYEGHRVKVKVTQAKSAKFAIPAMLNFNRQ